MLTLSTSSDMLQHILQAIRKLPSIPFSIPEWKAYIDKDDTAKWIEFKISLFPEAYRLQQCNALVMERVLPFAESIRHKLIRKYCSESAQDKIIGNESDQDCLIRPYLGKRRTAWGLSKLNVFSLRNFPFHIERIEELQLHSELYARIMAETLAILYWTAQVDANDVEFVLAPPRPGTNAAAEISSDFLGPHVIWIIDFDCCRSMEMSPDGVTQAVAAFLKNDPFYPRPGKRDVRDLQNWTIFAEAFLTKSRELLEVENFSLADLWIERVEAEIGSR